MPATSASGPGGRPPRRTTLVRTASIGTRAPFAFDIAPDAETRAGLSRVLGTLAIDALAFAGELRAEGRDIRLDARLRATVVQSCIVTLDPVTTAIDVPVIRRFVPDLPEPAAPETEMPEDDSIELLGPVIDLEAIMGEALALSLPEYPRAPGAELGELSAGPAGAAPLEETRTRPFAGLAGRLKPGGDVEGGG